MSIRHLWAVTKKEIIHIFRDRSTLFLVLVTPTALLLLMAYALTVDLKHIPIAVVDYDQSFLSRRFVQQISAGNDLDIYLQAVDFDRVEELLMRGEIRY